MEFIFLVGVILIVTAIICYSLGKSDGDIKKWRALTNFVKDIRDSKTIPSHIKLEVLTILEKTTLTKSTIIKQTYNKKIPHEKKHLEKTG